MVETIESVKARRNFYRDYYRGALQALIISLVIIVILVLTVLYLYLIRPTPRYYTTSSNGYVAELQPTNRVVTRP
jgi:hypothetical protein